MLKTFAVMGLIGFGAAFMVSAIGWAGLPDGLGFIPILMAIAASLMLFLGLRDKRRL